MNSYAIDKAGFAKNAQFIASPNFDARPVSRVDSSTETSPQSELSLIVIHNISLPPNQYGGNGIVELFTNKLNPDEHPYYADIYTRKVSSHFLIRRDGTLIQFVSCLNRAWHAGVSNWHGRERCNDFSIGVELEGSDFDPFDAAQYLTLKMLIASLISAYTIQAIVGHSDIAPGRKTDPGPYFDWGQVNTIIGKPTSSPC
jgi:N-acetyl-anhydromuramoyl-L-alanine amidase